MRALSGFIGFKGCVGGLLSQRLNVWAQPRPAVETDGLELGWSMRNAQCSGEMHRYCAELRSRRQRANSILTLRHAEARKRGYRTGLDTLVVRAVNDGYLPSGPNEVCEAKRKR